MVDFILILLNELMHIAQTLGLFACIGAMVAPVVYGLYLYNETDTFQK